MKALPVHYSSAWLENLFLQRGKENIRLSRKKVPRPVNDSKELEIRIHALCEPQVGDA
jgi:hypothetical protein